MNIQEMIDNAVKEGKMTLTIPAGEHVVEKKVTIPAGFILKFDVEMK